MMKGHFQSCTSASLLECYSWHVCWRSRPFCVWRADAIASTKTILTFSKSPRRHLNRHPLARVSQLHARASTRGWTCSRPAWAVRETLNSHRLRMDRYILMYSMTDLCRHRLRSITIGRCCSPTQLRRTPRQHCQFTQQQFAIHQCHLQAFMKACHWRNKRRKSVTQKKLHRENHGDREIHAELHAKANVK